jgi:hypothetical protein
MRLAVEKTAGAALIVSFQIQPEPPAGDGPVHEVVSASLSARPFLMRFGIESKRGVDEL